MRRLLIGALGAAALVAAPARAAETYNLTLAGASPGGLWSTIGAALDKSLNKAYPGSTVTYQTGSGGIANAKLVQDKKVPMGIAADMELVAAYRGEGPFQGNPQKDLRTLVRVYTPSDRFHFLYVLVNGEVAKRHGIQTMADLKKQAKNIRIAFNRPGNMDGELGMAVFEANGVRTQSFKQVVRAASSELTSLMLDRRIEAVSFGIAFNHSRIQELARGIPLVQIDVGGQAAAKVATQFGGQPCTIKAKEHDFLSEDKTSVCIGGVIVVHKDMDEATAYNLTKGILANIEDFKSVHRTFEGTTPRSMAQPAIAPHHPGALRAFKEAGAM
ncbi:MAG TPA: TAXI family TRAP transporter solute-binding subunit [Myxococcaceae bacterium]|nr:TAXI family TRAP transporter solute-binding subunit [Myxococcaceae bacterium]